MQVLSEEDFPKLRCRIQEWKRQFPMFKHDVYEIEHIIETYIQNYSIALVHYRQTKQRKYLERAQEEIDKINRVIETISKLELMALLAR